ncbi:zinc finger protein on ecdysone puffs isoform X2 [Amyelois transitella]|uniref:zinc finger protein on ecdysone puffs isoform X2 n=1 Tax=Amyelois transitella TaxID=680683 RepID=UPI002990234B|nr:zinc finger protein on ecdysone puffs isoform X2 [Amyelois transitella]
MSSRGRGYGGYGGRGGYNSRGTGYRGSYRGSRGSYESRGGRGGGYSSYSSDSRYNSGGSRYNTSRERIDEPYKKTYRSESSASYANRDYGGRSGSPERKRMRVEGSSSDRRSHDGGGHYGGSYGGRQESYGGERRSFGGEERRRSPARESYRKPSGMGPPRERVSLRPRAPRRSFRGRSLRSRASYRGAPRSRGTFSSRRFGERSLGYTRAFRTLKRSNSVKSKEDASSTEEDWDADEKEEVTEEKKEPKSKSPKPDVDGSEGEPEEAGDETDKEADTASEAAAPPRPRSYIQLSCVHCKEKCVTFARYAKHLVSSKHRAAMSSVARRHKAQLLRMRVAQRGAQRELEASSAADLAPHTTFCLICRLNHRTTRQAHNMTDTHRAMKRFLLPFCRICRLTFRSPMIYEHHICSLEHLKKKAAQANARRASPKAEGSGDEGMDVDLDNFMTLDSVGDVDVEDDDSGGEKKEETVVKKPKVEINIGSEHIKKVEVWWCELCRVYLPRAEAGAEEAEALRRHCRLRLHLGRYVQHRDTRTLRRHAERIHRQLHQQREEEKDNSNAEESADKVKTEKQEPTEEKKKMENGGGDACNTSGNEDKLWADVDKDIGELLREVDPQRNEGSDDDDDLDRYEKFRKSDKKSKVGDEETDVINADNSHEKNNVEVDTAA